MESDKIIAHIDQPKKLVAERVVTIPELYVLSFPEGSETMQLEAILKFILRNFKTISPNEILVAFEMNAAHKFIYHIDAYGKFSIEFVGKVLNAYQKWKALNSSKPDHPIEKANIEKELVADIHSIKNSGTFNITRYVADKWDWLIANRKDFDSSEDKGRIKELTEHYKNQQNPLFEKYRSTPEGFAINKFQAERIKEYLSKLQIIKQ